MNKKITTLTEFFIKEERKFKNATGSLTLLLTQIENAVKIIASHLRRTGLSDYVGATGTVNSYNDVVQKLDQYANDLLIDVLTKSGQVFAIGSEELEDLIYVKEHPGNYIVFFDPIDGSKNIETNMPVGTIFSIYHKGDGSLLQPGRRQVAAGYIIYGPAVIFVYTSGHGVNGFTLDPAVGSFLLSSPGMKIPETGNIYSINEGKYNLFDKKHQHYIDELKNSKPVPDIRYTACMVAEIHQIISKGGIFHNPANIEKPNGKIRLLYEINPMGMIVSQAGGIVTSLTKNPLDITPVSLSQTMPITMGSKHEVEKYLSYISNG